MKNIKTLCFDLPISTSVDYVEMGIPNTEP
jgi:hypothetical protein